MGPYFEQLNGLTEQVQDLEYMKWLTRRNRYTPITKPLSLLIWITGRTLHIEQLNSLTGEVQDLEKLCMQDMK